MISFTKEEVNVLYTLGFTPNHNGLPNTIEKDFEIRCNHYKQLKNPSWKICSDLINGITPLEDVPMYLYDNFKGAQILIKWRLQIGR